MKNLFFNFKRKDWNYLTAFLSILLLPFINAMMICEGEEGEQHGSVEKTVKETIESEMKGLKDSLKAFVKAEDMQKEVQKLEKKVEELGISELKTTLDELKQAAEEQGIIMNQLKERDSKPEASKSIYDILKEKAESLKAMITDKTKSVVINKTVTASNATSDVANYRIPGVTEIQRGMPWLRNLFNIVTLSADTHGSIDWWEQLAVTDNSGVVAEGGTTASQSNLTWVRKTLSDKILTDKIKVSRDQLKDIGFVAGEVNRLIERNMRLLENTQLLTGTGAGNNIKGITQYAQAFATAGIEIPFANLNDLVGKINTQIRTNSKDGFMPNFYAATSALIDLVRYAKDEFGQYIFPMWAQGAPVAMQGLQPVENNIITANTLLQGDSTLATIYEWDTMQIEFGFEDDDLSKHLVTIVARMRENLKVADNDVQGFVYIDDVATAIEAITEVVAP